MSADNGFTSPGPFSCDRLLESDATPSCTALSRAGFGALPFSAEDGSAADALVLPIVETAIISPATIMAAPPMTDHQGNRATHVATATVAPTVTRELPSMLRLDLSRLPNHLTGLNERRLAPPRCLPLFIVPEITLGQGSLVDGNRPCARQGPNMAVTSESTQSKSVRRPG